MNFFKSVLRLLRIVLTCMLLAYWAILIGYSTMELIAGGPAGVVIWYRSTATAPSEWDWGAFLSQQVLLLAGTVLLCMIEWRSSKKAHKPHSSSRIL